MSVNLEQAAKAFNNTFAGQSPARRFLQVAEYFSAKTVFTTSFGIEDPCC